MSRRIYILNGHPAADSLSHSFAETYGTAARTAGHEVRLHHLHELSFDMDFERAGYKDPKPLEPDLEAVLAHIDWAEHVVMFAPMWWGDCLPSSRGCSIGRSCRAGRLTRAIRCVRGCRVRCFRGAAHGWY